MPEIVAIAEMNVVEVNDGYQEVALADEQTFGTAAMIARRLRLEPHGEGPERVHGDTDQLLYVIRGSGEAVVDGQTFTLEPESMLWLEEGERYRFRAGPDGLEILQGYTPVA
jgi:quercetin dioxygenase-like cupin family protein